MKPISPQPHDPLDELLAAAVHGELTTAQRAELDALLHHDPAARAAYQEIQTMHDLLENNHREAKPDPNFEERMISAVRHKVRAGKAQRESMGQSVLLLWRAIKWPFVARPAYTFAMLGVACIVVMVALNHSRQTVRGVFATINSQLQLAQAAPRSFAQLPVMKNIDSQIQPPLPQSTGAPNVLDYEFNHKAEDSAASTVAIDQPKGSQQSLQLESRLRLGKARLLAQQGQTTEAMKQFQKSAQEWPGNPALKDTASNFFSNEDRKSQIADAMTESKTQTIDGGSAEGGVTSSTSSIPMAPRAEPVNAAAATFAVNGAPEAAAAPVGRASADATIVESPAPAASTPPAADASDLMNTDSAPSPGLPAINAPETTAKPAASPGPTRKLVRDATLDLEVKQYQPTVDAITELAKADGGYLDSSNSQRGGNGKLQGTVVAKIAPDKLDAFLLKLHDLGTLKNQSVSTEDVTKDYYDTQARLTNSRKMETQLQELLKHDTNKVADLLQVERELGRVRGEIEQMQGQLKLYDFQVQYATVTISVAEKDLNKAAAYLLQEHDNFALFVHDVEDAFAQAKAAADTYKAQILNADLQHGADNSMSATLAFSVPPDQVDGFLAKVKALGRVDNFTRTTSRVANDGGNSDEPADETRTDKDNAQVQLAIRADDESPRQLTNLTVASTGDIDAQAQALKDDAAKSGASVIASSFERAPDGTETAAINFRLPLAKVGDLMPGLEKLGRVEALTVSRNDRPGEAAAEANAPAEIDLRLHNVAAVSFENEPPRQQTELSISSGGDVDAQAQQLKADALKAGLAVTASTFDRQPDGMERAQLTFRLPLAQAAAYTDTLKKLGKVESLAIQRNDVSGPDSTDPNAPAEISLTVHSEPGVVAEDRGLWPTLQHMFGGGVSAFLGSVETIGVLLAFIAPWVVAACALAFVGRRLWVMRRAQS